MPLLLLKSDPADWDELPGKTTIGVNALGQVCTKQEDGTITVIVSGAPAATNVANVGGTTTLPWVTPIQADVVSISGSARAVPIVLDRTGAVEGSQRTLCLQFAAVAGYAVSIYDGTAVIGNRLDTYTSDGSILNGTWFLYFLNGKWNLQLSKIPAF